MNWVEGESNMASPIRHPAVAGRFYPRDRDDLRAEVESYLSPPQKTVPALGCVVPHAGYIYSGHVAGAVYARLRCAAALDSDVPQPYRHGTSSFHHECGRVGHAAGTGAH